KAALQRAFGLASRPRIPLFAMSARLVAQKGLDLILGGGLLAIPDAQFVFLGGGERRYEQALTDLAAAAPDRIAAQVTFTDRVEHEVLAGADMLPMPSVYARCGLTEQDRRRSVEAYVQAYGRALASRPAHTRHSAEAP